MKLSFLAAALWAGTAISTAAQTAAPQALDLVCAGQIADAQGVKTPWSDRLSLDLKAKRWCDRGAGCPFVFPILARQGDALQLLSVKTVYNEAAMSVDLRTGEVTRTTRIPERPDSATSTKGVCARAAFTPLA